MRSIFRQPTTPDGDADFSGQAHYISVAAPDATRAEDEGEWTASGHYSSSDVSPCHTGFSTTGALRPLATYEVANQRLVVPNLSVRALGGTIAGQLEMDFKGLAFRTKTQTRGMSLAQLFAALDNNELPVRPLHWDANVEVDSVNTWNANFLHFRTAGEMRWSPPVTLTPGMIPATARVEFDYGTDNEVVTLVQSEITTPRMQVDFDGPLGATDSGLEVNFRAGRSALRVGTISSTRFAVPEWPYASRGTGKLAWRGRILGRSAAVVFRPLHLTRTRVRHGRTWDQLDGDMEYSPDGFHS